MKQNSLFEVKINNIVRNKWETLWICTYNSLNSRCYSLKRLSLHSIMCLHKAIKPEMSLNQTFRSFTVTFTRNVKIHGMFSLYVFIFNFY